MDAREGRESFLRTVAQVTAERAAARPVINSLRTSGADVWDSEIPPSWRNAGFVQELTAAASAVLESDPRDSLALAQLALAIATSIPARRYTPTVQAQLEGTAWKEIGTAHRYLSEYDAALRAYDAAHRSFAAAHALAHDDAIVDFARAIVLTDLGRHDEALELLRSVEPVFRGFEDQQRLVKVAMLTGIAQYGRGQFKDAKTTFEKALEDVSLDDLHTRAMLYENLGVACMELSENNDAVLMLHNARQLLNDLGLTAELNRCDWNIARVLLQTAEFGKAATMLQRVRTFFLEKGMQEEAGLAGLDLADASIAIGATDDARVLVFRVLDEFARARLNDRALTALAYLRDALPTTPQPSHVVRHVRHYLDRLRSEPTLLFLPLPD